MIELTCNVVMARFPPLTAGTSHPPRYPEKGSPSALPDTPCRESWQATAPNTSRAHTPVAHQPHICGVGREYLGEFLGLARCIIADEYRKARGRMPFVVSSGGIVVYRHKHYIL